MNCLFWSVLAGFYLVLAIVSIIVSRPIFRDFKEIVKHGGGSGLQTKNGKLIWFEGLFIRAFKAIIITDIVGFFLATAAAVISALWI
ncbi:hypothetical protein ACFLWD_00715 [Chloroflexota bacterium]